MMYLILPAATLAWVELSCGKLRSLLQAVAVLSLAIGLAGVGIFLYSGASGTLVPYNNLLAAILLAFLVTTLAVPSLWRKFLVMPNRGVLLVGTLVFAMEALLVNLLRPLGYRSMLFRDSLGFAALLFSLGYVAAQMIFADERRLLAIENELAIARDIQNSILPAAVPVIKHLQISAAYHPMTAVAGDFYEFIPVDQHRVGILVANVSGHGVPAALIAAMIKMAVQASRSQRQRPRGSAAWPQSPPHLTTAGPVRDCGLLMGRYGGAQGFILRGRPSTTVAMAGRAVGEN